MESSSESATSPRPAVPRVEGGTRVDSRGAALPAGQFRRLERLAPLGYFAMGVGWLSVGKSGFPGERERMLAIANGSDWTPQPLTLHHSDLATGVRKLPHWFSSDYDHHMGLAVGDLNGTGYDDVVVAVFAGKNQNLAEGGVKVYRGGPNGLSPEPVWLARGFAATGVALADLTGTGTLDVVVSCLTESGTIQNPGLDSAGIFRGRARLLVNASQHRSDATHFQAHVIEHPAARGAGDVTVADVDLDGTLDLVFAGHRTAVLYGRPRPDQGAPWSGSPVWVSEEAHPFSFSAQAFVHPDFPGRQLVASSRGLFSATQLGGRRLEEIGPGILVHEPRRNTVNRALQNLAPLVATQPEIPAGLAVAHDERGLPCIIAGFLDARGRDIRGAAVRIYHGQADDARPFDEQACDRLTGGGLMAGRVVATPHAGGPTSIHRTEFRITEDERGAITLPLHPAGELLQLSLEVPGEDPASFSVTRTSDGRSLTFSPPLPPGSVVSASFRTADEVEIVATSSAAWPPAGASGVWRGRLSAGGRASTRPSRIPPPNSGVMRAG